MSFSEVFVLTKTRGSALQQDEQSLKPLKYWQLKRISLHFLLVLDMIVMRKKQDEVAAQQALGQLLQRGSRAPLPVLQELLWHPSLQASWAWHQTVVIVMLPDVSMEDMEVNCKTQNSLATCHQVRESANAALDRLPQQMQWLRHFCSKHFSISLELGDIGSFSRLMPVPYCNICNV